MKISHFEEFPIWKKAAEFALKIFEFTNRTEFDGFGCMKEQLNRASLSISTDTAKGFVGPFENESLNTAKETVSECQSMLAVCREARIFAGRHAELSELIENASAISKMIDDWEEARWNDILSGRAFCPCGEIAIATGDASSEEGFTPIAESEQPLDDSTAEKRQQDTAVSVTQTERDNCML